MHWTYTGPWCKWHVWKWIEFTSCLPVRYWQFLPSAQYFHIYFPATQGRPQSRSDGNYYQYQMMRRWRRRRDVWLTPKLSDTFCSLHWSGARSPWPSSNDNNILHVNYPWQTCTRPYRTWTMKFYKTQNIELKHNYLSRVYTILGDKDAHYYSV